MKSGKRKTQRGDARGGRFLLLPYCLLRSEAFRMASPRAIKVLLALCAKHDGFNNGRIGMGFRDLAEWIDCQNHTANSDALGELVARGIVAVECQHPKAQRLSTEYRLTFMSTEDEPATNDYLHWKQGDAGTVRKREVGNFRVAIVATETADPAVMAATGEETSRCDSRNRYNAKPPFLSEAPVAMVATHICKPFGALPKSSCQFPQNIGGPLSAAPDPEGLRARVLSTLDTAARGSQGQLAALAKIRPAALSKFLGGTGSLNDASRIRLTLALPKIASSVPVAAARQVGRAVFTDGAWKRPTKAKATEASHCVVICNER